MRSGGSGAEHLEDVRGGGAPHNREGKRARRLAVGETPRVGHRDQMSPVLAAFALDQGVRKPGR